MARASRPRARRPMRLSYSLAQVYFEIARSAIATIEPAKVQGLRRSRGLALASTLLFAAGSLTVVYSFLAVEAIVNYHLYHLWMDRSGVPKRRLQAKFPTVRDFGDLRKTKLADLRARIKALCMLLNIDPPHKVIPKEWAAFTELLETARHFLTHPIPERSEFQGTASLIMSRTPAGKFVVTAGSLIAHFYVQVGQKAPSWLTSNEVVSVKVGAAPRRRKRASERPSNVPLERTGADQRGGSGTPRSAGRSAPDR